MDALIGLLDANFFIPHFKYFSPFNYFYLLIRYLFLSLSFNTEGKRDKINKFPKITRSPNSSTKIKGRKEREKKKKKRQGK